MKIFLTSILLVILLNCSFDNKTGIWKTTSEAISKKKDRFKGFETLYTQTKSFNRLIEPEDNLEIILDSTQSNFKWTDEYYKNSNNLLSY